MSNRPLEAVYQGGESSTQRSPRDGGLARTERKRVRRTTFEILYLSLEPFCPPLYQEVRAQLQKLAKASGPRPEILDVGGRLSNYTIGLPANITVTDIERRSEIQKQLHLGTNEDMMARLAKRRSNITSIRYDDMTRSTLASSGYDGVVAVEVLEHVEEDEKFVAQVRRVLKPGKTFLMTTPNGEFVKNVNPDHKRHYTREQLKTLLEKHFDKVDVWYAVKTGSLTMLSARTWSLRHPLRTIITMAAGALSALQSRSPQLRMDSGHTYHLVACATTKSED